MLETGPRRRKPTTCRAVALAGAAALALAAGGPAWADPGSEAGAIDSGKKAGQRVEQTARDVGRTVSEGAKEVARDVESRARAAGKVAEREAKPVGDRLHDSAKGFGEAIWGGMRYVGRTVKAFFTGD
jgi:hypothetical protein